MEKEMEGNEVTPVAVDNPATESPTDPAPEKKLNIIGDHDAILYSREDVTQTQFESISEDFFKVTQEDIKAMFNELKEKRDELENRPLTISSVKAMEKDSAILQNLKKHPITVVRIRFPSHHILQGTFRTIDTISAIKDFVKSYLADPDLDFYLFTTPPKKILPLDQRLVEENLVGRAIIFFGTNDTTNKTDNYLKPEILEKKSTPEAVYEYLQHSHLKPKLDPASMNIPNENESSTTQLNQNPDTNNSQTTEQENRANRLRENTGKVPKWFKKGH